MGFSTDAIHGGQKPDPTTGAVSVPIYQTSTYAQEALGVNKGYEYARTQNPTREALERSVALLEGGKHGLAFASGMATTSTLLMLLEAGDHVVASEIMYGGSYRVMALVFAHLGLEFTFVDARRPETVRGAIQKKTRLVFVETPTNPTMGITDLAAVARIAHENEALLAVDNTFMTPYFQKPLAFGADVVVHSTTKYLNGHSDMVGGVLVTSHEKSAERLRFLQNAVGAVPGPMDCWLALRGVKTLALRMERHDANARAIARHLEGHRLVKKVHYPGLASHPQHELAKKQMTGFGGMISFETGSLDAAKKVLAGARLFTLAESLGAVESLISHPATMTHASLPKEDRERIGVTDGLVRLSVGIEDVEDLIADLDQALGRIS